MELHLDAADRGDLVGPKGPCVCQCKRCRLPDGADIKGAARRIEQHLTRAGHHNIGEDRKFVEDVLLQLVGEK